MLQRHPDGLDLRYDKPFVPPSSSIGLQNAPPIVKPPPPLAHRASASRHSPGPSSRHYQLLRDHENTLRKPASSPRSEPASMAPSLSPDVAASERRASRSDPSRSAQREEEKSRSGGSRSPRSPQRSLQDPEKANQDGRSMRSSPSSNPVSHHSTIIYDEEEEEYDDGDPKNHAVWILVYLSALNPFLSMAMAIYSLFASLLILLLSPLRLCTKLQPATSHFSRFLVPPLRYQLGIVYSVPRLEDAPSKGSSMPILIGCLAPLVAVGVCIAAWVAGGFWLFAKILGNPNANSGKDDESNDGRATVMGVKDLWVAWLLRGFR